MQITYKCVEVLRLIGNRVKSELNARLASAMNRLKKLIKVFFKIFPLRDDVLFCIEFSFTRHLEILLLLFFLITEKNLPLEIAGGGGKF